MNHFSRVSQALQYIDCHLEEPMNLEILAEKFFFSPFYFHRIFSAITGKSLAAYIRDRRILFACRTLSQTEKTVLEIALENGFHSPQAFSRAFKASQGLSPIEYRRQGCFPEIIPAEELIVKFTNRLKGGILLHPRIIKRPALRIAGACGDGSQTAQVWQDFAALCREHPPEEAEPMDSYEVRLYEGERCTVYAGYAPADKKAHPAYTLLELPASQYAVFDVYVERGYDSENSAMDEWLETNGVYTQRALPDGRQYCIEYYDERFHGEESGSIVEIWVPIEKGQSL